MKDSDFQHSDSLIYIDVFQMRNKRLGAFLAITASADEHMKAKDDG